jgi:hypothetical protein
VNQEQVKEKLRSIHESPVDYNVIFSGKKNKSANGLYKPLAKEIIIHDKNFIDDGGNQNERLLMFTAIHELAHHVMMSEKGQGTHSAHNQDFWAAFHDLLDIAEKKGVYRAEIDGETQKLIDEARDISLRIAELQRELGRVILAINEACGKKGLRCEDIIERKAQIDRRTAKTAVGAYNMGGNKAGIDIQTAAAKQRDEGKRKAIIEAAEAGKSLVQAKKAAEPAKPESGEDRTADLAAEKKRIERTIETLARRLEEIKKLLAIRNDDGGGETDEGEEILRLTG